MNNYYYIVKEQDGIAMFLTKHGDGTDDFDKAARFQFREMAQDFIERLKIKGCAIRELYGH